jgi:hypothetical protein
MLGDLGWKWVYIGGRGRGVAKIAMIAGNANIPEIERQGLKRQLAQK